eukprot:scaffold13983_cov125-Isochrysis_galbana.AAC.9
MGWTDGSVHSMRGGAAGRAGAGGGVPKDILGKGDTHPVSASDAFPPGRSGGYGRTAGAISSTYANYVCYV